MQKAAVGAVSVIAVSVMVAVALALSGSYSISNTGTVKAVNVGVYADSGCTSPITSIAWGILEPGQSASKTIYVKNEGSVTMTITMTSNSWNPPSAAGNMTLTWNKEGTSLVAGAVVQATLTLSVSQSITGISSFSFNIVITGTA